MELSYSLFNPKFKATFQEAMSLPGNMEKYNLAGKIIKHGKRLGKRILRDEVRDYKELRYARFRITTRPDLFQQKRRISIPIPYMKTDHGIIIY